jgi:TIR domain
MASPASTPLNQRANNVFLSHSSQDKSAFVDGLYQWLTRTAGLKVWYDRNLISGEISSNLEVGIDSSKAAVIVLSEHSAASVYVQLESSRLQEEVARSGGDFRIATLRLDSVDPPGLLKAYKHIDVEKGALSVTAAAMLMDTLFGGRDNPEGKSVYLSRGWRLPERAAAERITQALRMAGLRMVADCTDQPDYDRGRVCGIIESTGGLVAILPNRGAGGTSRYILSEIDFAKRAGLPLLVFAHKDVAIQPEWGLPAPVTFDDAIDRETPASISDRFGEDIEDLVQAWRQPAKGEHIFLGHSLEESMEDSFLTARTMLARITGLPVVVGGLVNGADAQGEIVRLIRGAGVCVIDITNLTYENLPAKIDFALNSSIEAGIALGAERVLYLTCKEPRRSPPFMFRNKQIWFYKDGLELIGVLSRIAANHRRMVL